LNPQSLHLERLHNPGAQYSVTSLRSLITMSVRTTLYRTNGSLIVKPLVVLAARFLGPGPLRLKLVKLAHQLSDGGVVIDPM
jgi:hypothetical protein